MKNRDKNTTIPYISYT